MTAEPDGAHKAAIFIGSSSEAKTILHRLVDVMSDRGFDPRPWTSSFSPGWTTLEVLDAQLREVEGALLIFSKDDKRDFRGDRVEAARDNVVLEFGFFVSHLGARRVWILEEEGVGLPTDVLGLTTFKFRRDSEPQLNARINRCVDEMAKVWPTLPPLVRPNAEIPELNLGLSNTLSELSGRIAKLTEKLRAYAEDSRPCLQTSLNFDSARSIVSTYGEALNRVQNRFWTTTFLSSGFWTRTQPPIIEANARMMNRLKDSGGQARRLFLLDQPPHMVAEAHRQHRQMQRQLERNEELARFNRQFENLKLNVRKMVAEGFETRAVFDENELFRMIADMVEDPTDEELAIYDTFRVDVFEGGRLGVMTQVKTFTPLVQNFEGYLQAAEHYFQDLWEAATPIQEFLDQLQQAADSANSKIDYASNWLALYEFGLSPEDQALKTVEIERVKEVLRETGRWGRITRYLDVGTCTGRYPIQLRDAVTADGKIIAIDEDFDCFRFTEANRMRQCPHDERIQVVLGDFAARQLGFDGPFDLITCMLGTLSHFGRDRQRGPNERYDDQMQRVLNRMASLLSADGLLILGTWTEHAKSNSKMLEIYRPADKRRLAQWTPSLTELNERLAQANLHRMTQLQPNERLDFTVCHRAK